MCKWSKWEDCWVWPLHLQDTQERLQQEEDARNQLFQGKKKLEQELSGLKKDIEDLELTVQKVNMKLWQRWLAGVWRRVIWYKHAVTLEDILSPFSEDGKVYA